MTKKYKVNRDDREPEPNAPGSIEQQLDMCETSGLKGEELSHSRSRGRTFTDGAILDADRETAEMSGDDHSMGLQGGDPETDTQPHPSSGLPGDESRDQDDATDELERHRAG
jgi:hypothetical protein